MALLSSERLELLAYNSAAAVLGGAAMFALLRTAMLEPAAVDPRSASGPAAAQAAVPRADRLGFAKPGSMTLPEPPAPELRPTLQPQTASFTTGSLPTEEEAPTEPVTWSTETHAEAKAAAAAPAEAQPRRFQVLPSLRLPWQSAKPAQRSRPYTLKERINELGPAVAVRLAARFDAAKAVWPPKEIALVAIKDERALELHARGRDGGWTLVHRYRVLAASGHAGPKLFQGDRQVPEGVYNVVSLNPNSAYHVSLRVGYPNAFDRQMAAKEGRKSLGGDIMIHGRNLSAGCLAMGDEAAEELFVLAAQVGLANVKLVIAPTDFRQAGVPTPPAGAPDWLPRLYADIATAMAPYKAPPQPNGLLSFFSK